MLSRLSFSLVTLALAVILSGTIGSAFPAGLPGLPSSDSVKHHEWAEGPGIGWNSTASGSAQQSSDA